MGQLVRLHNGKDELDDADFLLLCELIECVETKGLKKVEGGGGGSGGGDGEEGTMVNAKPSSVR